MSVEVESICGANFATYVDKQTTTVRRIDVFFIATRNSNKQVNYLENGDSISLSSN
jgi:hypothetical protein